MCVSLYHRRCTNFMSDIKDSEIYTHLLKQIAPNEAGVNMDALTVMFIFLSGCIFLLWRMGIE